MLRNAELYENTGTTALTPTSCQQVSSQPIMKTPRVGGNFPSLRVRCTSQMIDAITPTMQMTSDARMMTRV